MQKSITPVIVAAVLAFEKNVVSMKHRVIMFVVYIRKKNNTGVKELYLSKGP